MENITIVKIIKPENYRIIPNTYGILCNSLEETAVINFDGNKSGICINIKHEDYRVVPSNCWDVRNGEVVITDYIGCIPTGLKVWY